MKVEVRSKEIGRPSSPTPQTLKNYKLSFLDQLHLNLMTPFVFFYDSPTISGACHHTKTIDELKKSLSKTLSLMYPLAGRVKEDKVTIECDDEGVEFIVADVAENMSCLLENPEMEKIKQLIPSAKVYEPQPVGKALVAVQVNRFSCGGIAIGFFVSHAIADASALAKFMEIWASFNRGCAANNGSGFVSDHSSILFPPLTDTSAIEQLMKMGAEGIEQEEKDMIVKRFVIPANAIAQLRQDLTITGGSVQRPSRVEALTALVWAAVINATPTQTATLSCMVNLRRRMEPPLPPNCLGTLVDEAIVLCQEAKDGGTVVTAVELVQRIRDAFRAVKDGEARKVYGEGGWLRAVIARGYELVRNRDSSTLYTSSLCRMAYYEVDFGWGKPRLVVNMLDNSWVLFLDAINGAVEVWMKLPKQVMHTLTQDRHFLAYVSAFPKPKL
ncbi:PREDICTED: salutaridinol 7-O-acetyltransferase-like [Ipomoea nil]|uniref:salutaridinol 7-O-acetyltransferase-like n=1 Tax=Ipomoea nil TaxID=35883 RepID=UPI0009015365|nr:PREDICTED: salutaridinol 7-O-acetyltransferase-like [Ipomoea nil]